MTDFEHSLRKVIKEIYQDGVLEGCYFHSSKVNWNEQKKIDLVIRNISKF